MSVPQRGGWAFAGGEREDGVSLRDLMLTIPLNDASKCSTHVTLLCHMACEAMLLLLPLRQRGVRVLLVLLLLLSVHPAACLELRTVTVSPCGPCEQSVTMTDVMINSCKASAEEMGLKHDDNRLPFQIFPDPCDSYEGQCKLKDRLPSIVVEPTDVSEVESGELRWPPEEFLMAEQGGEGEGLVPQAGELAQNDTEPVSQELKTQKNVEPGQSLSSDTQSSSSTLIQPGQTFAK